MGNKQEKPKPQQQPVVQAKGPNSTIAAIGTMKKNQEQVNKRIELLDKKCAGFVKIAKEKMKKGDKRGAMFALKQKKLYAKQQQQLENQVLAIQQQIVVLEGANMNRNVVQTMQIGNNATKAAMRGIDIDTVEDLRDDIADMMDMQDEIGTALGAEIGMGFDEDEIENELRDLEVEDTEAMFEGVDDMSAVPSLPDATTTMPVAPTAAPTIKPQIKKQNSEDAGLAELEAMMA